MGFFDRNDGNEEENTEEVKLSVPDENGHKGQLEDEAEAKLTEDSSSPSDQDNSSMLPGMGSGSSSSGSGKKSSSHSSTSTGGKKNSASLEDIHRQNKQIKSILKDIRSEIKDEGDINGVL